MTEDERWDMTNQRFIELQQVCESLNSCWPPKNRDQAVKILSQAGFSSEWIGWFMAVSHNDACDPSQPQEHLAYTIEHTGRTQQVIDGLVASRSIDL